MVVKNDTLYSEIEPALQYLAPGELERLKQAAPCAIFGAGGYYAMTVGQLASLLNGATPEQVVEVSKSVTVYEYMTLQGMQDFLVEYAKLLERFTPPQSAAEKGAGAGCYPTSPAEGLLLFTRDYFKMSNFRAAEHILLGELLIAKKDNYNRVMRERAFAAAMRRKEKK